MKPDKTKAMKTIKNNIQLIGPVQADPVIKITSSQKKNARLLIATKDVYRDSSGEKVATIGLHVVSAWGQVADFIEASVKAGTTVIIGGTLIYKETEDGPVTEILADEILITNAC